MTTSIVEPVATVAGASRPGLALFDALYDATHDHPKAHPGTIEDAVIAHVAMLSWLTLQRVAAFKAVSAKAE